MSGPALLFVIFGVFFLLLWLFADSLRAIWWGQSHDLERSRMPRALAQGTLVYSEQQFICERPRRWVARVDQVYRQLDGLHVVVDTKTRPRIHTTASDVIELSVQAMVLRSVVRPDRIATWGWIRIVDGPGRATYRRVTLLSEAALVTVDQRYRDILTRRTEPAAAAHPRQCRSCAFAERCVRRLG